MEWRPGWRERERERDAAVPPERRREGAVHLTDERRASKQLQIIVTLPGRISSMQAVCQRFITLTFDREAADEKEIKERHACSAHRHRIEPPFPVPCPRNLPAPVAPLASAAAAALTKAPESLPTADLHAEVCGGGSCHKLLYVFLGTHLPSK